MTPIALKIKKKIYIEIKASLKVRCILFLCNHKLNSKPHNEYKQDPGATKTYKRVNANFFKLLTVGLLMDK